MDRNVSVAVIVLAALVGAFFWWGWRNVVVGAAGPPKGGGVSAPAPAALPDPPGSGARQEPRFSGKSAVLSEARPSLPTVSRDDFWLWDGALLATRSLDDLATYRKEEDRPPVGYPNGTSRNQSGQTPKQRELLSAGYIVLVPAAARIRVIQWGSNDMAQVRVEEGAKSGATGWINRHLLRYNRDGVFEPVYPVNIQ